MQKKKKKGAKCGRKFDLVTNKVLGPFLSIKSLKGIFPVKNPKRNASSILMGNIHKF